jgi:folate-binding protein YgfZ
VPESSNAGPALEANIIADDVRIAEVSVGRLRLMLGAEAIRLAATMPPGALLPVEGWGSRGAVFLDGPFPDLDELDQDELESRAVLSGLPRWGVDVDRGTPIYETPLLGLAVSSSKGCYLGQETVAKVASGRGAARAMMLLEISAEVETAGEVPTGRFATASNERAGEIVSVVCWNESLYAVARMARELRVEGRQVRCIFDDGRELGGTVRSLPILETPSPERWAHELTVAASGAFAEDRDDDAIDLLEQAIAVCPSCADAYESLGVIHGRHERYDEAIALMHRLLEVDPESVMAHTNLSLYYNRLVSI